MHTYVFASFLKPILSSFPLVDLLIETSKNETSKYVDPYQARK